MIYRNVDLAGIRKLASELAGTLHKHGVIMGLVGPLGSGKTTFVKAFAKKLHINKISSPTFVITHQYRLKNRTFFHLDFYRLHDKMQLRPLGIDEILSGHPIVLIEWVDKFPSIQKKCDIIIKFKVKKNNLRDVEIQIPRLASRAKRANNK